MDPINESKKQNRTVWQAQIILSGFLLKDREKQDQQDKFTDKNINTHQNSRLANPPNLFYQSFLSK